MPKSRTGKSTEKKWSDNISKGLTGHEISEKPEGKLVLLTLAESGMMKHAQKCQNAIPVKVIRCMALRGTVQIVRI